MIAVVGPGDADQEILDAAERVGALLASAGHQVVTGGLGGVMTAASRGAKSAGGSVV
ncbi:MAG TPA: TIGR00725 family protein, partial [Mycobacteriales bacterium]|nr:TIGR00725 family protein [Mycobacteriales bacterium]